MSLQFGPIAVTSYKIYNLQYQNVLQIVFFISFSYPGHREQFRTHHSMKKIDDCKGIPPDPFSKALIFTLKNGAEKKINNRHNI